MPLRGGARMARPQAARGHAPRLGRAGGRGGRRVASLPRAQAAGETVRDPASLIPALVARPRAFGESAIRADMPEGFVAAVDRCGKAARRQALRAISRAAAGRRPCPSTTPSWERGRSGLQAGEGAAARIMAAGSACSLTKAVLAEWAGGGTSKQVEHLEAERASRDASKRASLMRRCAVPSPKTFGGYDWTAASWPDGFGRDDLLSLSFLDGREDLVLMGDVGTDKTHRASALCALACSRKLEAGSSRPRRW